MDLRETLQSLRSRGAGPCGPASPAGAGSSDRAGAKVTIRPSPAEQEWTHRADGVQPPAVSIEESKAVLPVAATSASATSLRRRSIAAALRSPFPSISAL